MYGQFEQIVKELLLVNIADRETNPKVRFQANEASARVASRRSASASVRSGRRRGKTRGSLTTSPSSAFASAFTGFMPCSACAGATPKPGGRTRALSSLGISAFQPASRFTETCIWRKGIAIIIVLGALERFGRSGRARSLHQTAPLGICRDDRRPRYVWLLRGCSLASERQHGCSSG